MDVKSLKIKQQQQQKTHTQIRKKNEDFKVEIRVGYSIVLVFDF